MPKKDELNDRRQLAILMHKYKADNLGQLPL